MNPCLKCEVLEEETGTLKEEDGVELKVVWDSTPSVTSRNIALPGPTWIKETNSLGASQVQRSMP